MNNAIPAGPGPEPPLSLIFDPQKRLARLAGALTVDAPRSIWRPLEPDKASASVAGINGELTLDLAGLTALDLNGSAQVLSVINQLDRSGVQVSVRGLPDDLAVILELAREALKAPTASPPPRIGLIEETGRKLVAIKNDAATLVTFTGKLVIDFLSSLRHPSSVRWATVEHVAEVSGVNAVPIVALVSLLVGLIIAFQSAMVLKFVGLEIFVADMVGVAIVRELGPLITAIVLAGRSGSAFSAELGAMKAAEEVDAITTMGLSPVRELALPRVLASLLTTPVVTLFACFAGIWGGCLVLTAMGYSLLTYWQEAISMVTGTTFNICIFKSIIFGFVVAAIGCQRGLAAGDGPGAVGEATTSGVVTNIVVVAVIDSLLAVLFYVWDI
ncbi:MAG: ABC transporter permease [Candidatus Adiutrix sp.]|nr:ABC transporter permease [Candidatus Adiutrix sp.]